jgi:hypothetical protein
VKDGETESEWSHGLITARASNGIGHVDKAVGSQETPLIDGNRIGRRGQGQRWRLGAYASRTRRRPPFGRARTLLTLAAHACEDLLIESGEEARWIVLPDGVMRAIGLNRCGRNQQAGPQGKNCPGPRPGPSHSVQAVHRLTLPCDLDLFVSINQPTVVKLPNGNQDRDYSTSSRFASG